MGCPVTPDFSLSLAAAWVGGLLVGLSGWAPAREGRWGRLALLATVAVLAALMLAELVRAAAGGR